MKNTAIPLLSVAVLLITACSSSFSKVREAVNQAPDWYGERRTEIRGEGYPKAVDVPVLARADQPGQSLSAQSGRARELAAIFEADPRAEVPTGGAEEIRAIADEIIAEFAGAEPPEHFLTVTEIAAIRGMFNVPRVTQD